MNGIIILIGGRAIYRLQIIITVDVVDFEMSINIIYYCIPVFIIGTYKIAMYNVHHIVLHVYLFTTH